MLTLTQGAARCTLHPAIGGSLGSWSIGEQQLLRPAGAAAIAAGDPLGMALFPLVPYSNRIAHAAFDWQGTPVQLRPNYPPEPHAIHGVGWRRSWTVGAVSDDAATLALHHPGDADWPWPFLAEQHFNLTDDTLRLDLSVRNLADTAVPLAFGVHPYFDARGAQLRFNADSVWLNDAETLPTHAVAPTGAMDFATPGAAGHRDVDNCYSGWDGQAGIDWAGQPWRLAITASHNLAVAVVYSPRDADIFCFEPLPHINNALHSIGSGGDMPVIAAGATFSAEILFSALANETDAAR